MNIDFKLDSGILYVLLSGELDEYSANFIRESMDNAFENNKFEAVVFELTNLDFMDSTGVGLLIGRDKKLRQLNIPSYISGASINIEKVIELAGLYKIMPKI